ncbi:MAG: regulatory iron-sulfur-containing complex subunit RicT [Brevinematia bacterium]
MKLVYVKVFLDNTVSLFSVGEEEAVKVGDYVIVDTKYGKDIGRVVSVCADSDSNEVKRVTKASEKDIEEFENNRKRDFREDKKVREILKKYHPQVHFVGCYFLLEKRKLIVNFCSEERIDFRETVKTLAGVYKTRIEMRQISSREAFKIKGSIGICGMECCCFRFNHLKQHISSNLVKEQNLSEINAKTIGPCGKLLCCLAYEYHCYSNGKHVLFQETSVGI